MLFKNPDMRYCQIFLPESVLDKSKACFRRLQNSPSAQTVVIAYLALRQAFLAKTLSMAAQMNVLGTHIFTIVDQLNDNYEK